MMCLPVTNFDIDSMTIFFYMFSGRSIHSYFKIRRPKNVRLSFEGIVNRANSPFVLTLCLPEPLNHHSAEVNTEQLFGFLSHVSSVFFAFYSFISFPCVTHTICSLAFTFTRDHIHIQQ